MKVTMRFWFLFAAALALLGGPLAHAQKLEDRMAEDQYNFATELFGKKLYELAIQQYEKFAADYPKHANVVRARIRIGESYLRLNKFQQAADAYSKVLTDQPQSNFRLERPLKLPAGTRIECTAHFDNSKNNPNNPDPTKTVYWGDQTWQEMMIGFVDYIYTGDPKSE